MKFLQKAVFLLLSLASTLTAHIFMVNFFPFPYNRINAVFTILIFILITRQTRWVIWLALILSCFLELLSGIPFGIGQSSLIISLLVINWFQLNILTNRSAYIIFLLTFTGIIFYRFIFFTFLIIYNYFSGNPLIPGNFFIGIFWEALSSALVVFILYIIYTKFVKVIRKNFRMNY